MSKLFKVNVSVLIFKKDKILVQKRAQNEEMFPGLWGIPGGTVEITDNSLEEALFREVDEEVGIKIKNLKIIQNNLRVNELYGTLYIVYIADYLSGKAIPKDGTEDVLWINLDTMGNFEFTPKTFDIIKFGYKSKKTYNISHG